MTGTTLATVAFAAVNARFALIHEGIGPREMLDALAPDHLVAAVREGRRRGLAEFTLGPRTSATFALWADTTVHEVEALRALWNDADGRQRGIIVEGLKAGLMSDEAALGATIGSLFGPLGMTVGGALGGMLAGNKLDEDLGRSVKEYLAAVDAWYDRSVERYNASVPAAAAEDDTAPAEGAGWLALGCFGIGALAVLCGLVYGAWRVYEWINAPGADATTEPVIADAATPPPVLAAKWIGEDGVSYTLERRGPEIVFLFTNEGTGGSYRAGETVFVLTDDGAGAYLVSHVVRPDPPRGAAYQDSAFADCARTVTTVDGTPLRGRRAPTGFELDAAVIELPARSFERGARRAQIVGCSGLGDAVPFRRMLRLAPVLP